MRRLLAGSDDLVLILGDDELRLVIGPLEQNLLLLQLLYPVALTVVLILAAGLAVLIVLQSAKIAAIMRSLGAKVYNVRLVLCGEYLIVSVIGAVLAASFMFIFNIDLAMIFNPAGLYLTGALIGVVTGSILNTNRSVLELLQVRE
jgi:predicted lysophospholipase L1 biosynthesis ABC-type transport system permease subunit